MTEPQFVTLHSPACTAIWELCGDEAPLWRYWGPRLPDGVTPGEVLRATRPEPSFSLHFDQPLGLFPGLGMGWFGNPAVAAHRDGHDWTLAINFCQIERPDDATVVFHLRDDAAKIGVTITARLDPKSDVLALSKRLTNVGAGNLEVQWLASGGVPLPEDARTVRTYGGRHNSEFVADEAELTRSIWRRENRRGLTSHESFPGALVECGDGTAYAAQLAWSGNHVQQIEWTGDGRRHWQMGEWLAPGEVRLGPGESLTAPEMLATCSPEGANGVAWNFHRAVRGRIGWPGGAMKPRPVHINTWEGCYFDHDETALRELASDAAGLGVERFVLDDGWFNGRDDDTSSLGDWWADARKYPDGLSPLAKHVTGLGMEFGLWVEPEMISRNSDLFRSHPEWVLASLGRPLLEARHQLVLDMTRPEVGDYLFGKIAALLADLPISYLKWDHNRALTHAGATPLYRRQVLACYALIDRIRAAFPDVEIESCAGGGGRIDVAMAGRTHRFWPSDCIDAVSRIAIQRGFLQFMPPEIMGSHIGASPAHSTGRSQAMAFRTGVALPGHFGVELDPRQLDEAERDALAEAIARYKALRGQLHGARVWLDEGSDGLLWQAHGDAAELLLFILRAQPSTQHHQPHIRLPMLDPARRYRLSLEGAPDTEHDGAWLQRIGIATPPMKGEQVLLYRVTAL